MATVILQARTGSTRLPGKVLKEINGKPMLYYTIITLKKSEVVSRIVLATSDMKRDDILVDFAKEMGIDFFRGSEENVLKRFYYASLIFKDEYYFRATGDNPILDWNNPERTFNYLKKNNCDYACERNMPIGSIIEGFTQKSLQKAYDMAKNPDELEHVTVIMKKNREFLSCFFDNPYEKDLSDLRLTVDYEDDFKRAKKIIENLYINNRIPDFEEILKFKF